MRLTRTATVLAAVAVLTFAACSNDGGPVDDPVDIPDVEDTDEDDEDGDDTGVDANGSDDVDEVAEDDWFQRVDGDAAREFYENADLETTGNLVAVNWVPSHDVDRSNPPWALIDAAYDGDVDLDHIWDQALAQSLYSDDPVADELRRNLTSPTTIWPRNDGGDEENFAHGMVFGELDEFLSWTVRVTGTVDGVESVHIWTFRVNYDTGEVAPYYSHMTLDVDQTEEEMLEQFNELLEQEEELFDGWSTD